MQNTEKMPLVSVYTCVYNGEKTIHRVFDSVKALTYPNIEHVIINDGSTDGTKKLVEEYISGVSYPVKYREKENGGKHTALNVAWEIAEGEFMIQLDADDKLLPHSVSYLVDAYYSIPEDTREQYWCVHGRCETQNGDFVGTPYPDGINDNEWRKAQSIAQTCGGEKVGLQVRKYLSQYRFPEVIGTRYLTESIVWKQINAKYGTWYTNEVVRVYYVNEGGNLSESRTRRSQFGSLAFYYKWQLMHPELYGKPSIKTMMMYSRTFFVSSKEYRKNNKYLKDMKNKPLLALLCPVMFLASIAFRAAKRIK